MPTVNLGRIGFVNKGDWSSATAYKVNDVVRYNNNTYACLVAHTNQTPPATGNTTYWQYWAGGENLVHKGGDVGAFSIGTNDASNLSLKTNNATRVTVDSGGNVGIGTSSPIYDLQIGSYGVDEDSTLALASTTTGSGSIRFGDGAYGTDANSGVLRYNHSDNSMHFLTTATERARITSTGNLLVGTTTELNPTDKLQVNGAVSYSATIRVTSSSTTPTVVNEMTKTINNGGGANICESAFGDAPISGELYAHEIGTGNYLNATFYKRGVAYSPVVTILASSGLSVSAINTAGTVALTGFTYTNNVRMMSKIKKLYS